MLTGCASERYFHASWTISYFSPFDLVFIDDLLLRPVNEMDKMISFLGLKVSRDSVEELANRYIPELEKSLRIPADSIKDDVNYIPIDLIRTGISSIESEFLASNNLNK
jgi:hypothetical protein